MITRNRALFQVKEEIHRQHPYRVGVPPGNIKVKLNQNESPFDLPTSVLDSIVERWKKIPFHRYPSEQPVELTKLISDHIGWDSEGIIIGNGSNELTYTLGLTFIASGRKVVLPRPMFSFYERVVEIFGGEVISIAPREDLQFDTERILSAIHEETPSVVVITSPNNPTGLVVPLGEIKKIAKQAPGMVLIDEAYIEFADEPSFLTGLRDYPNVILLRTFSKAFGLAGIRLGYLVGDPALISEVLKVRPPFMIDRFSTIVVEELLLQFHLVRDRIKRIRSETKRLIQSLEQMQGIQVLAGQANFVTFRVSGNSKEIFMKLAELGILVRDMGGYPELEGFLRVSAGERGENRAFLRALTQIVS